MNDTEVDTHRILHFQEAKMAQNSSKMLILLSNIGVHGLAWTPNCNFIALKTNFFEDQSVGCRVKAFYMFIKICRTIFYVIIQSSCRVLLEDCTMLEGYVITALSYVRKYITSSYVYHITMDMISDQS